MHDRGRVVDRCQRRSLCRFRHSGGHDGLRVHFCNGFVSAFGTTFGTFDFAFSAHAFRPFAVTAIAVATAAATAAAFLAFASAIAFCARHYAFRNDRFRQRSGVGLRLRHQGCGVLVNQTFDCRTGRFLGLLIALACVARFAIFTRLPSFAAFARLPLAAFRIAFAAPLAFTAGFLALLRLTSFCGLACGAFDLRGLAVTIAVAALAVALTFALPLLLRIAGFVSVAALAAAFAAILPLTLALTAFTALATATAFLAIATATAIAVFGARLRRFDRRSHHRLGRLAAKQ